MLSGCCVYLTSAHLALLLSPRTMLVFPVVQVWKARQTGSLQTVAVKLITKHGKNEKDLRNLRQEIEILRKLQHPNIIAMLDAFETKNDFCVVTEFAQGEQSREGMQCCCFSTAGRWGKSTASFCCSLRMRPAICDCLVSKFGTVCCPSLFCAHEIWFVFCVKFAVSLPVQYAHSPLCR